MQLLERDSFLHTLTSLFEALAGGAGRTVLVSGEAGIGKTTLVRHFASGRKRVLWGACEALFTPRPLGPLHDIALETQARLLALLEQGRERPLVFAALLDELKLGAPATVLVLEDVHWADEATLDLIKFLGRRIHRLPVLMIVTYRDDEVTATHPLRAVLGDLPPAATTRMPLPPLSPAAVDTLARAQQRNATGLHAATRGNPFFVSEILASSAPGLPHTVRDAVLARLHRLGSEARAVAELAAIVPGAIEQWLLDAVAAPGPAQIERCVAGGLLVADAGSYRFRHELARLAVEESLAAPHAQRLHARVLSALTPRAAEPATLARLVHHAARAGDAAAVMKFAPAAARQAAAHGAHREAAAHYATAIAHARGVDAVRQAELLDARAYECYLVGDIEQAVAARTAALVLWRGLGRALKEGDCLRWLSRLHWFLGHKAEADANAADAVRVLEPLPAGPEVAMAYSNKAQLHMLAGEVAPAAQWGNRAIELAGQLGATEILTHALNNVGTAKFLAGDPSGRAQLERSLALALEHGLEEHAARAYCNLASGDVALRDCARAMRVFDEGIAYCIDHDLDAWSFYLMAWRAEALLQQGKWDDAAAQAGALLARPQVPAISRIPALAALGRLRVRRGDPGAGAVLDEALALALATDELQRIWPVACARAEAAWLAGDNARCALEARRAFALAEERQHAWALGEMAWWLARAAALDAVPAPCAAPYALQLEGRWQEAAAAWAAFGCPYEQAQALAEGDAAAQLEALAIFERLGAQAAADCLRRALRARGTRAIPRGPRASTRANPFGLTARELDMLAMLAQGLSNAQIGARRHISVRTVDHHVAAILAKLNVSSRNDAVAVARAHRLLEQKPGKAT
ncbi:MAG TPA: AAA family ATPase [Burkholderiaceae bacterium]|nr:AAA family ATPase [Burkholderiaceae bacterium]